MRNGMKAGLWCFGFLLAWSPGAGIAASDVKDIPIAQWPAPATWRPESAAAPADARASAGRTALAVLTPALPFFAVTPCRLADTRVGSGFSGAFGPPALVASVVRNFPIAGQCSVPATAQAVSLNFTVINPSGAGFLSAWPQGGTFPGTSTINYSPGQLLNNAAIVALGSGGIAVSAGVAGTDLIIDVNGYYAPSGNWTSTVGVTSTTDSVTIGGNLTVSGTITASKVFNAAYGQDVAEWVQSAEKLRPGTVVVIDSLAANQVVASSRRYDTAVAGVVSDSPGILLGKGGTGRAIIATTGRVKVRVDATKGPISIGDLLVTSDRSGVAMRSRPIALGGAEIHRPGTLIGKALEPLSEGEGEILVLLSLQ